MSSKNSHYEGQLIEVAKISAIASARWMKMIHELDELSYFDAIDVIVEASIDFFKTYEKKLKSAKTDWVTEAEKLGADSYDQLVEVYVKHYLVNKYGFKL